MKVLALSWVSFYDKKNPTVHWISGGRSAGFVPSSVSVEKVRLEGGSPYLPWQKIILNGFFTNCI